MATSSSKLLKPLSPSMRKGSSLHNHELRAKLRLHQDDGSLADPGWARQGLWFYDREAMPFPWYRRKEWDYYLVVGQECALSLTISDIGYMGVQSVSFFFLGEKPWVATNFAVNPMPRGSLGLGTTLGDGLVSFRSPRLMMEFATHGRWRHLSCNFPFFRGIERLRCEITLEESCPEHLAILMPWSDRRHFYYNQKLNLLRASGFVEVGERRYEFAPTRDFATLDWGRGVWTHDNSWWWSSGNAVIEGASFGFNLGYGFADRSAATENVLFYEGRAHKLDEVQFLCSDECDYESLWIVTSSDGRFEASFTPIIDRRGAFDVGFAGTNQHQVFGRMNGHAILDNGRRITMRELLCFIEHIRMKY